MRQPNAERPIHMETERERDTDRFAFVGAQHVWPRQYSNTVHVPVMCLYRNKNTSPTLAHTIRPPVRVSSVWEKNGIQKSNRHNLVRFFHIYLVMF